MNLHGFYDIRELRVRAARPDYLNKPGESSEVSAENQAWLGIADFADFFSGSFSEKNPLNIPGSIYGAMTDTCATGPQEAPNHVLLDGNGQEFVYRQAANAVDLQQLISAANFDPFGGYGADGDAHWRLSLIREWWHTREDMLRAEILEAHCKPESVEQWKLALQGGAEGYLRVYAFFVENCRVPVDGDTLPDLG